jgi:septal ring factor EnvC (AmiA/AmiB activator)
MTNEEFERAIDFLLKSQARFEAQFESQQARFEAQIEQTKERQARTDEQLNQLTEQVNAFADTQTDMMRVMTRTLEAQDRINESLRAGIGELAAKQAQTEVALAKLTRNVDTLANTQSGTNRRLDALIRIVEEDRNSR